MESTFHNQDIVDSNQFICSLPIFTKMFAMTNFKPKDSERAMKASFIQAIIHKSNFFILATSVSVLISLGYFLKIL